MLYPLSYEGGNSSSSLEVLQQHSLLQTSRGERLTILKTPGSSPIS